MRPKIVILTLVLAVALIGLTFLLKGVRHESSEGAAQQTAEATANTEIKSEPSGPAADQSVQKSPVVLDTNKVAAIAEELRAAEVDRQLEEIEKIRGEADGDNNATVTIPAIIAKMSHPEAEVRKGALEALKLLNDTNAVPALEKMLGKIQDLREKVAVLDTIEYLKLPSAMPDAPRSK